MITETGIKRIAEAIGNLAYKGKITINDTVSTIDIYRKTVSDNKLTIMLLIDDVVTGTITKKEIVNMDGEVIFENAMSMEKNIDEGLLVTFEINIREVIGYGDTAIQ